MADLLEVIKGLQSRLEILERSALVGSPTIEMNNNTLSTSTTYRQATAPLGLNKSTDVGSVWLNTTTGALQWWDGAIWWSGDYPYSLGYNDIRVIGPGIVARNEARERINLWSQSSAPGPGGYYDIWYDTTVATYKQWSGSAWISITDTKLIIALQALVFPSYIYVKTSPPAGAAIGNYWLDSDDNFRFYRWNGIAWETVSVTPNFIVPTTDGLAPSYSPDPTITGLIKSLIVMWNKVPNVDAVTYEVHISTTTGFTPSGSTFSQQTVGTMALISTLPNGSLLVEGTTYYVKLVAKDNDGAASASNQTTGQLGLVGTNQVDSITADKITAGNLLAVVALIGTLNIGSNISISPGQGILITLTGGGIIQFPSDGSEATIQSKLRTSDLVVNGGMTLNGSNNVIAGTMTLMQGVSAPKNGATVASIAGLATQPSGAENTIGDNNGFVNSADNLSWYCVAKKVSDGSTYIKRYTKSTGALTSGTSTVLANSQVVLDITRIGPTLYVLHGNITNAPQYTWFISKFDATTLAYVAASTTTLFTTQSSLALGTDGTNICIVTAPLIASPYYTLYKRDATTLAAISQVNITGLGYRGLGRGLYFGDADLAAGTGRFWMLTGSTDGSSSINTATCINSNALEAANSFSVPSGCKGIVYDGTRFWSQTLDSNLKVIQFSNVKADTTTYVGWTLYDATGTTHETPISTVITNLSVKKRAWLNITAPASFPSGTDMPDSVRFYCGTAGSSNSQLWRQTDPGLGIKVANYETLTLSGSNAPTVNGFAGVSGITPGDLRSEAIDGSSNPYTQFKGDGSGRFGSIYSDSSGNTNVTTYGVVNGLGTGTNNVPTTWTAQGSGLTITTTQANQVVELFGYIDVGKPNGTNGTFQMELDIDGDIDTVATVWSSPSTGFRTTVGSYRIVTIAAAGPHTFNLRVLTSVATTYNVRPANGRMYYRIIK